jgi:hypothetical protein
MRTARLVCVVHAILLSFALTASGRHVDLTCRDELIATLESIARGYEANASKTGPVRVRGRIFNVQQAQEGRQIPPNKVFAPQWMSFDYIQKDNKRRYEQDRLLSPGERVYALDNNEKLALYATPSTLRIFPLADEEYRWSLLADLYHSFVILEGAVGKENVGRAMHSLVGKLQEGRFEVEGRTLSVDASQDGLLTITEGAKTSFTQFVIDSRRGFNLVARKYKYLRSSGQLWRDFEGAYEYSQLANGAWVLAKGRYKYSVDDGTVGEGRLEVTDIQTQFEAPDEIFELDSLHVPPDVPVIDHSYSPPRVVNKGN